MKRAVSNHSTQEARRKGSSCFMQIAILGLGLSWSACSFGNTHPHTAKNAGETSTRIPLVTKDVVPVSSADALVGKYRDGGKGIPNGAKALLRSTASFPEAAPKKVSAPSEIASAEPLDNNPLGHTKPAHPLKESLEAELLPDLSDVREEPTSASLGASGESIDAPAQQPASDSKPSSLGSFAERLKEKALAIFSSDDTETVASTNEGREASGQTETNAPAVEPSPPLIAEADSGATGTKTLEAKALPSPSTEELQIDEGAPARKTQDSDTIVAGVDKPTVTTPRDQALEPSVQAAASPSELALEETLEGLNGVELPANSESARARLADSDKASNVDQRDLFWEFALLAFLVALFFFTLWVRLEKDYGEND